MASVNKVTLMGRLGADPELRYTAAGKAVAELRLATSFGFGEKETTEWHRVIVWEKRAEVAGQYLHKGSPVYIEGRIQTRTYDDKDGNKRYITEIVAHDLQLLGKASDRAEDENETAPTPSPKKVRTRKTKTVEVEPDLDDVFGE